MNWADYTILGVIVISIVISLFRGFIREVMGLLVWIAAFWAAWAFADEVEAWLVAWVGTPSARLAIAFVALFLVALLLGGMVNYVVGQLVTRTGLSGSDRFFGLFFGAARGLVLITAVVMLAGLTPVPRDPWWQQSRLIPGFEAMAQWVGTYLPADVRSYFDYGVEEELAPQALPDATAAVGYRAGLLRLVSS